MIFDDETYTNIVSWPNSGTITVSDNYTTSGVTISAGYYTTTPAYTTRVTTGDINRWRLSGEWDFAFVPVPQEEEREIPEDNPELDSFLEEYTVKEG